MRARSVRSQWTRAGGALLAAVLLASPATSEAGEAQVVAARADCEPERICHFTVTVRHADNGWEHYADRWEVLDESGRILAVRVLRHPHVDEQPFTRSLIGVVLPAEVERVRIRAHDSVHGDGPEVAVELDRGD